MGRGAPGWDSCVLVGKDGRELSLHVKAPREAAICKPRREPSPGAEAASISISDFHFQLCEQ